MHGFVTPRVRWKELMCSEHTKTGNERVRITRMMDGMAWDLYQVVWNPWDRKAKAMPDFGDDEYKHMLCVEAAAIEKPITLKPGEEWKGRLELSAVPSSYCSGQLDPRKVLQG
ncbi:hypothetical protein BHE74_00059702 [Ensete ventricosum]|nr:hypothetical protein BHE74_00059702 [Ensete ventricosum]RZR92339.1 hypothetical protein BHM03_00020611 [Ensete ventricosum]